MRYDLVEKSRGMAVWKEMEQAPADGEWVKYDDFAVVMDSHNWLFREKERLEKLSTQFQRDNSALIARLARYESAQVRRSCSGGE